MEPEQSDNMDAVVEAIETEFDADLVNEVKDFHKRLSKLSKRSEHLKNSITGAYSTLAESRMYLSAMYANFWAIYLGLRLPQIAEAFKDPYVNIKGGWFSGAYNSVMCALFYEMMTSIEQFDKEKYNAIGFDFSHDERDTLRILRNMYFHVTKTKPSFLKPRIPNQSTAEYEQETLRSIEDFFVKIENIAKRLMPNTMLLNTYIMKYCVGDKQCMVFLKPIIGCISNANKYFDPGGMGPSGAMASE